MTRSWWGWGTVEDAVRGEELDGLTALVAAQFDRAATPLNPPDPADVALPAPRVRVPDDLADLADLDPAERLRHGHGQSFRDVARALRGVVETPPDVVLRPRGADDVVRILDWASTSGTAIVPFGGGTSVVGGVTPPDVPCVSVDLTALDRVLEVDTVSRAAHVQAGMYGPAVEDALRPYGLTLRHFPQSWEFSTVGGWLVTRAGGHYATRLTHIDDLVESIGAETPAGRWDSRRLPGSGAGPSPDRLLLGSEGTLGVVTDAWLRVQARPSFRGNADVVFTDVGAALAGLRALAQSGIEPANCRVLDPVEAALAGAGDGTHAVLVLGVESADHPMAADLDRCLELLADHGGTCPTGPRVVDGDLTGTSEGAGGAWRRTFLRAPYLRDALIRLGMVVETFETAVTWDAQADFVTRVTTAATESVTRLTGGGSVSMRVTHAYPDGFAPYWTVIAPAAAGDPVAQWDEVKAAVSDEILAAGGTITHHHAVGRDHAPWYGQQAPEVFRTGLAAMRSAVDPAGICNPGVLGLR